MARKVIIDCDPGIDDAVAICLSQFDPRLDVLAITATEGNAGAEQTSQNVQAVIEQLDPPRYPRFGKALPSENPPPLTTRCFHGSDGLGNWHFNISKLHHEHPSEKVICDVVRASPGDVTLLTLGPLTNVARALTRDPELASMLGQIVMMGGSTDGTGNATSAAEFNMYYDPAAARTVFESPTTKTLIPFNVTRELIFRLDVMDALPDESTRAGAFLRRVIPFLFRSFHEHLGLEGIYLHDAVALMAVVHPELFETVEMFGDVETRGELTSGATVFDRRLTGTAQANMEVVVSMDTPAVLDAVLRGLRYAGNLTSG